MEARKDEPGRKQQQIRVLFVNDHLGFAGGVTTGGVTYLLTVLARLDATKVRPMVCACRAANENAARFRAIGVDPAFLGRGKWDPRVLTDLIAVIRRNDIDIVHLNGIKSHLLGRLAAWLTGRRAIVHLHFLYWPRPAFLQPWLARRTNLALAVSKPLRDRAIDGFRIPPERVEVLHNGLDVARFANPSDDARERIRADLGIDPAVRVVAVIGRISSQPDKGHKVLLRAMPAVRQACTDAVLVVVGDGPARQDCEELAGALHLSAAVRFTGQRSDIPDLLATVDAVAIPSMVAEALPFVALEATAAGRPVVAFDVGGMAEIVFHDENGLLVEMGDVEGLSDGLTRVLLDPALAERLGQAGRRRSQHFTIEQHVERLEDTYAGIMRPSGRRPAESPARG